MTKTGARAAHVSASELDTPAASSAPAAALGPRPLPRSWVAPLPAEAEELMRNGSLTEEQVRLGPPARALICQPAANGTEAASSPVCSSHQVAPRCVQI